MPTTNVRFGRDTRDRLLHGVDILSVAAEALHRLAEECDRRTETSAA